MHGDIFEAVTIPNIVKNETFTGDLNITVNAYAIQAVGFGDVYEAYEAYNAQA